MADNVYEKAKEIEKKLVTGTMWKTTDGQVSQNKDEAILQQLILELKDLCKDVFEERSFQDEIAETLVYRSEAFAQLLVTIAAYQKKLNE